MPIQRNTDVAANRIKNMAYRQMKVTAHEGGALNILTYKYKPYREATRVKYEKSGI